MSLTIKFLRFEENKIARMGNVEHKASKSNSLTSCGNRQSHFLQLFTLQITSNPMKFL